MRQSSNALRQCFTFLAFLFVFTACKQKAPPAEGGINLSFEQAPPEASDITVSALDKPIEEGNVLLTARFDKRVVTGNFHAVMAADEKLVLRDDGKGGDEKAADGIFSIVIRENIEDFRKELTASQQANKRSLAARQKLFKFVNRSAVPIMESVAGFGEKDFSTAKIMRINPDALFAVTPDTALTAHSLMVTDLAVVQDLSRTFNPCTSAGDSNGAWTFGKLMAGIANTPVTGVTFKAFAIEWLKKWMVVQVANGDVVNPRNPPGIFTSVVLPWLIRSNPTVPPGSITTSNWTTFDIKPQFAPFRLLAIVNRLDLRGNAGYSISNAGEGRFVFGVVNTNAGCTPLANPGKFTVIFEYAIPKTTCASLKAYAQAWVNLKTLPTGSVAYNNALQAITDQFAAAGAGVAGKPNGSSINQIRTNEFALQNNSVWQLREFVLNPATHTLIENTTTQEPASKFNRVSSFSNPQDILMFAKYVNANQAVILNNTYTIPFKLGNSFAPPDSVFFRGAEALPETPTYFWDASPVAGTSRINNDTARHIISIGTCSGCHAGEGATGNANHTAFLHITPQPFGTKASLSSFLTGDPAQADGLYRVTDPAGRPQVWTFNDLARRNIDLQVLAGVTCKNKLIDLIHALTFRPVNMSH